MLEISWRSLKLQNNNSICEPDTALEDTSGIDGTGNTDASSLLAKSRHDLLPPDESHVLKRDPVSVRQKYLSPGMILTHIDGKAVPNTYDGALLKRCMLQVAHLSCCLLLHPIFRV